MVRSFSVDPDEAIVIRDFRYRHEADLAQVVLDGAGIPSVVLAETYTELASAPIRLAVRRADVADARRLLDAPPDAPPSLDSRSIREHG
jgi:hypothetical protein